MTPPRRPRLPITPHQVIELAARAHCATRTLERCYRSQPVRSTVAERVCKAARELGLPEPAIVVAR